MRTSPVKALAGIAVAATLALAPITAANATTPARSLTSIASHEVTYAPGLYQIDATVSAVTGGTVRASVSDANGVPVKDYGVVASAAVAGTVAFTVPKADFVGAGLTNQLYVEVFNAAGVKIDGQGAPIAGFLGAPVTLATIPGLATPTLVKKSATTLTATLAVTKGQPGTTVKVTMWSPKKGEFAEYLKTSTAAPQKATFSIPTADFGGSNGNHLMVTVYNSAGQVIDGFSYTAHILAPSLKL